MIGLVTNIFSHFTSHIHMCLICIQLNTLFELCEQHEIYLISSLIYEYMATHTLWLVFYINNNINNILLIIEIVI